MPGEGSLAGFALHASLACRSLAARVLVPPWPGAAAACTACAAAIAEPDSESVSASHSSAQALDSPAPQAVDCPRAAHPPHEDAILFCPPHSTRKGARGAGCSAIAVQMGAGPSGLGGA